MKERMGFLWRIIVLLGIYGGSMPLFGQTGDRNIEFYGRVSDTEGNGIADVPVTDGLKVVVTDRKGNFRLMGDRTAEFIYITLPAGYRIPMADQAPCLFQRVKETTNRKQRFDFQLERLETSDDKHLLVVWSDPQVYFEEEMDSVRRAVEDVAALVKKYADRPAFGVVCGDIIGDIYRKPSFFGPMKASLYNSGIPFFYVVGNHDMDLGVRSNDRAKATFKSFFGPTYYSFNRGKVHYVVLDDNFYIGRSYMYVGYVEEKQLKWLEQDLALVPEHSTVVVCTHIPTWSREARSERWGEESSMKVMNNRRALYDLLKPYRTHIMSGHEHYNENYVISERLFEHVHAPLSTLFWQTAWSMDGVPCGYAVYEVDGDHIEWYFKAVGYNRDYQFNAYPVGTNRWKPEALTANVWNYDPAWKVYWYENGIRKGEMERYTGYDPIIYQDVVAREAHFKHKYIGAAPTEHLFFALPESLDAELKIEVVDRFGNVFTWEDKK